MDAKNIIEKIWNNHIVVEQKNHPNILAIDFMLLHEVTSAQAFDELRQRKIPAFDPKRVLATLDHSIPTTPDRHTIRDVLAKKQVETLRNNTAEFGITLYDFDSQHQGVVHVMGPELGLTQPGMTLVCGDSHTATHGAFGVLAFGIGTSVVAHVLASSCLLIQKPKVMRVNFEGVCQPGVYAKDVIMRLIAEIGIGGANGYVIEYVGSAISNMSMEERMTVCNMSIECGAIAGIIAPDETTFQYLQDRKHAPKGKRWEQAITYWKTLNSDEGCHYDREICIDINSLQPMVSWGTNPGQAIPIDENTPDTETMPEDEKKMAKQALAYVQIQENTPIKGIAIDWAFIGSCTNGRIEDMRVAAQILKGNKVHEKVVLVITPGSEAVLAQCIEEGIAKVFQEAGADFRMPGCSMCLSMNEDKVPNGKRCISSTNRNFVGRQGTGSITHIASPATVAASAIAGKITHAGNLI